TPDPGERPIQRGRRGTPHPDHGIAPGAAAALGIPRPLVADAQPPDHSMRAIGHEQLTVVALDDAKREPRENRVKRAYLRSRLPPPRGRSRGRGHRGRARSRGGWAPGVTPSPHRHHRRRPGPTPEPEGALDGTERLDQERDVLVERYAQLLRALAHLVAIH